MYFKKLQIIILACLPTGWLHAQNNTGIFNITISSIHHLHYATEEYKKEFNNSGLISAEDDISEDFSMAFGLENITGFFITENISAGAGFGYQGNTAPYFHTWPVYADLRGYMHFSEKESMYIYINGGSLINFDNRYNNGLFFRLGFGGRRLVKNRFFLFFGLAVQSKQFDLTAFEDPSKTHHFSLRSTSVTFGIGF